ncbi:hypothetical protein Nepgr_008449 [Nepenthes gracilis]|uniref:Homeobox domain-containing protein n=1 Tax=Nepenthes gracilis TaxID=150966 RepID=A0AAD3S9B1_NEPGR|nr:hypothetical protein Nepgr_008449 [Nepenthes gracilis]
MNLLAWQYFSHIGLALGNPSRFHAEAIPMEWENQLPRQQQPPVQQPNHRHNHQHQNNEAENGGNGDGGGVGGVLYVKVMTDEQLEVLRTQIAVYATICEQLVEMHKAITTQQDLSGVRLGNLYCDPVVTSIHKITARQRWTPTPVQLQILECIFCQGIGTPSKQKIKEITNELTQHGQISETNVYNWFQNRRARSKRKQLSTLPNNAESEVETDAESPNEKKTKPENFQLQHNSAPRGEDICSQSQEISSEMHSVDPQTNKAEPAFPSNCASKASQSIGQLSFYESILQNSRMDHFIGKLEVPGSYDPYQQADDYSMTVWVTVSVEFQDQLECSCTGLDVKHSWHSFVCKGC